MKTKDPIITKDELGGDEIIIENHESYGLLNFSRITVRGKDFSNLFGSSLQHNQQIRLTVSRAEKRRHLNQDRFSLNEEIVVVDMSPTQFAEAITSMNIGSGIPVTIRYVGRESMADCPEVNMRQVFENEFKKNIKQTAQLATELKKEALEILDKKTILKKDRKTLGDSIHKLIASVISTLPFIQSQFNEAIDDTVKEAKGEIEAAVAHVIQSAGLDAIADGSVKGLVEKQFPKLVDPKLVK